MNKKRVLASILVLTCTAIAAWEFMMSAEERGLPTAERLPAEEGDERAAESAAENSGNSGEAGQVPRSDGNGEDESAGGNPEGRSHRSAEPQGSQILLSMGQEPETLFISWKGTRTGPRIFRFSRDEGDLPLAEQHEAKRSRILQSGYYRYTIKMKDLKPGREYYYEIGDGVNFDSPRSFVVPRQRGATEFLYLGDVQFESSLKDYEAWGRLTRTVCQRNPGLDFALIGGDMVNVPTEIKQWDGFLEACDPFSRLPVMTVAGNHEGVHSNLTYRKIFALPENGPEGLEEEFYYFDYGHCRFLMLDSSFLTEARRESLGEENWQACEETVEAWLRKTLQKNPKTWTIVVVHHPPYGMHDRHTVSPELRELWTPIMEEGGVDLVLSGHQHTYMRTGKIGGILYLMGNSGAKSSEFYNGYNAPLYSRYVYADGANYQIVRATASRLELTSYDKKGLVIDEVSLKKGLRFHVVKFLGGG